MNNSADKSPLTSASGVWMDFNGVDVLKDAAIELWGGEIHGIVGENGAGKSTLARIIGGVHVPRAGVIRVDGRPVHIPSPRAAMAMGIALIHQEPLIFPELSVAENIFIGRQPTRRGAVDWRRMFSEAAGILASLGVHLSPRARVGGLSIADQQMVEMAAALSQQARVLLMDETTAALTPTEVERLFGIMRRLRDQGRALAFISHRLEEVLAICDRITVLRDGAVVGQLPTKETSIDQVLKLMVGRPMEAMFARDVKHKPGQVLLEVRKLSRRGRFQDVSFDVRAGEIVALAGLVGAGRTDVARAIFGVEPADGGQVLIDGRPVRIRSPRDAMAHGLALVPEDRQHHGLLMPLNVWHNATLPVIGRLCSFGWLRNGAARSATAQYVHRLGIRLRHLEQPVRKLSGGNQQKLVLSKWLLSRPRIMILDEPTRGIDVGAKAEVHRLIAELAAAGVGILMISSELPEVLAMSDRILVMREGRLTAQFARAEATAQRIIAAATGQVCTAGAP